LTCLIKDEVAVLSSTVLKLKCEVEAATKAMEQMNSMYREKVSVQARVLWRLCLNLIR
jgi:hypothetical protein